MPNRTTPVDGQPWPFADFIRDSPLWAPSGVVGVPATAYGSGDLALSFDIVSGTSVTPKLALGRGRSRGGRYERTLAPWSSGMSGTAPQDGSAAYALNTGSNPRRDRIVLRRDNGLQAVYPIILVGTPAASPVAVALTQVENGVWDEPLFSWTLPGGSSTAPTNITDERRWIDPGGNGRSGWSTYTPTWTALGATTQPTIGNGTLAGRFRYIDDTALFVKILLALGSTTSGGNGTSSNAYQFTLPPGLVNGPMQQVISGWYATAADAGPMTGLIPAGSGTVTELRADQNNSVAANGLLTATGNYIALSGVIELG